MRRWCRERFPHHRLQRKPPISDPGMHHGTCITHVPWCMSGSLTRGGEENVSGVPGACTTRNFAYLVRGPWSAEGMSTGKYSSVPFYKNGLTLIPPWINNHLPSKVWDEIAYTFPWYGIACQSKLGYGMKSKLSSEAERLNFPQNSLTSLRLRFKLKNYFKVYQNVISTVCGSL